MFNPTHDRILEAIKLQKHINQIKSASMSTYNPPITAKLNKRKTVRKLTRAGSVVLPNDIGLPKLERRLTSPSINPAHSDLLQDHGSRSLHGLLIPDNDPQWKPQTQFRDRSGSFDAALPPRASSDTDVVINFGNREQPGIE